MNPTLANQVGAVAHYATKDEIRAAISLLDSLSKQRIVVFANRIFRRHPGLQAQMNVEDLIQEGLTAVLDTRNWDPSKVDFPKMVSGAMRSFASNETRKNTFTRPDLIFAEESRELEESAVSGTSEASVGVDEVLIQRHQQASESTRIAMLKMLLSGDSEALAIFNLLLDNKAKRDIKTQLGWTDKQYWAADRRLNRIVKKTGDEDEQIT